MSRPALAVLLIGLLQMAGDATGVRALKGLGAATTAAPAPKVFSAVSGYETYTTGFFVEWDDERGARNSVPITAERYQGLRGPYNRRNVYGAVLAYGPVMPADLRDPVIRHALCGARPLLTELGLDVGRGRHLRIRYQTRPGLPAPAVPLVIAAPCGPEPR